MIGWTGLGWWEHGAGEGATHRAAKAGQRLRILTTETSLRIYAIAPVSAAARGLVSLLITRRASRPTHPKGSMRYYSKSLGISLSDKGMAFASYDKGDKVWAGSSLNLHTRLIGRHPIRIVQRNARRQLTQHDLLVCPARPLQVAHRAGHLRVLAARVPLTRAAELL